MSEVKKLGPFFLMSKLGKFSLFDNFFPDLANFRDLHNFPVFDYFPYFSINLLLLSILPVSLAVSTLLVTIIYDNIIVFSIDVSSTAILLKP